VTETTAVPRRYRGTQFRSILEADWAATLDHYSIEWEYEPALFHLKDGSRYIPDFWLPKIGTVIEVKGPQMERAHKTIQLSKEVAHGDVIVLFGFPAHVRTVSPGLRERFIQWRETSHRETRFTRCAHCSAWQWLRPILYVRASVHCRRCDKPVEALLAKSGEMRFMTATPDRPAWMGAH
jgi:hypothetical protein